MRVLVTRPEAEGIRTAGRLEGLGHTPLLLPLTQVRPVAVTMPLEARDLGAVVVTSANALRFADPAMLAALVDKPCFAVGSRTAGIARALGFRNVVAGPGDAEGLASLVLDATERDTALAYLCGRLRRDTIERELGSAGRRYLAIETYEAGDVPYTQEKLRGALGTEPFGAILLYSPYAAERLVALWANETLAECAQSATIICISRQTADILTMMRGPAVTVAAQPHEDAMFDLLHDAASRPASDPFLRNRV
jgi:uroporphyrinogen-III synthase